mmetsp:Transcript_78830/g.207491  ORF Transcript_78830/g.207491 Transcript_78830/m.207491 type:complete len:269 (-) Transcript_78830:63-869(-)
MLERRLQLPRHGVAGWRVWRWRLRLFWSLAASAAVSAAAFHVICSAATVAFVQPPLVLRIQLPGRRQAASCCPSPFRTLSSRVPRTGSWRRHGGSWRRHGGSVGGRCGGSRASISRGAAAEVSEAASPLVEEALREFGGDLLQAPRLLRLYGTEPSKEQARAAFRRYVREEHPDVSPRPDAEARLHLGALAHALLTEDAGREQLREATRRVGEARATPSRLDLEMQGQGTPQEVSDAEEAFALLALFFGMIVTAFLLSNLTMAAGVAR